MKVLTIVMLILVLASCAVVKVPAAVGGSRSDGTVKMAYQYGMFETPEVDWNATKRRASERCKAWGYNDAQAFGASMTACISYGGGSCNGWQVTTEYQCTSIGDIQ